MRGERGRCGVRIGRHRLVPDLDRVLGAPSGRDVAPPHPGGAAGVARRLELGSAIWLDPEARVRAVRDARVVRLRLLAPQPRLLEQRAGDVAAVADDVDDDGLGERRRDRGHEVGELRRLLDRPDGADEPDPSRDVENPAKPPRRLVGRERGELRDGGLDRRDLAEIDEPGQRPDRPGEERRAGARRADDEHEPVVEAPEALAEAGAAPRGQPLGDAELVGGGVDDPRHGAILAGRMLLASRRSTLRGG